MEVSVKMYKLSIKVPRTYHWVHLQLVKKEKQSLKYNKSKAAEPLLSFSFLIKSIFSDLDQWTILKKTEMQKGL